MQEETQRMAEAESSPRRRAALWMTPEEADAFLNVLMTAPPSEAVPAQVAERLLCRVADVRRALFGGRPRPARRRRGRRRAGGRRFDNEAVAR